MPDITIDGSSITGLTIDGTDVTEVTIDGTVAWRAIITNGLVSRWTFESGSGTTAVDSHGTHNGSISGAVWSTTSKEGSYSLDFVPNDYVSVPDHADFDLPQFSIVAWVYPRTENAWRNICSHGRDIASGNRNWWVGLHSSSSTNADIIHYSVGDEAGNNHVCNGTIAYTMGAWQLCTATYDGSTMKLYRNDTLDNSVSDSFTPATSANPVGMGAAEHGGVWDHFWDGLMDDVRIYNRALSASEISDIANGSG